MGCAPFTKGEVTLMGSTWRSKRYGTLNDEEWSAYGYSPRRRSVSFNIGECLLKGNYVSVGVPGPYRQRYDEVKVRAAEVHPEWLICRTCEGTGKLKSRKGDRACTICKKTPGKVGMRVHRHASLLMTKRLLRNLWCEWNKKPVIESW